jgi:hypothetical protein
MIQTSIHRLENSHTTLEITSIHQACTSPLIDHYCCNHVHNPDTSTLTTLHSDLTSCVSKQLPIGDGDLHTNAGKQQLPITDLHRPANTQENPHQQQPSGRGNPPSDTYCQSHPTQLSMLRHQDPNSKNPKYTRSNLLNSTQTHNKPTQGLHGSRAHTEASQMDSSKQPDTEPSLRKKCRTKPSSPFSTLHQNPSNHHNSRTTRPKLNKGATNTTAEYDNNQQQKPPPAAIKKPFTRHSEPKRSRLQHNPNEGRKMAVLLKFLYNRKHRLNVALDSQYKSTQMPSTRHPLHCSPSLKLLLHNSPSLKLLLHYPPSLKRSLSQALPLSSAPSLKLSQAPPLKLPLSSAPSSARSQHTPFP